MVDGFERLETLTLRLLRSHRTFTSDEFMEAYNIIYMHCTEITPTFETRGKRVYECLRTSLCTFVDSLHGLASLNGLHQQICEFSAALELLAKVYSYVEKYFIRISLEKREGHVQNIRTLAHCIFYRNHAERAVLQIRELVLFEIGVSRCNKGYGFQQLAETVAFLKRMFYYSDEEEQYNSLVRAYLSMFRESMDFDGEIGRVLKRVYLEIYVASRVFDADSGKLYRSIVGGLRGRFGEILRFVAARMDAFERFRLYAKIVHFMDEECMGRLVEECRRIFSAKILESSGFEALVDTYLRVCAQVEENLPGQDLVCDVQEQVRQYFECRPEMGERISGAISQVMTSGERIGELDALVTFMALVQGRDAVVERVTLDLQRRLLGARTDVRREGMLVSLMEKHLGASSVARASISYSNQTEAVTSRFDLPGMPGFATELRLLTKGFYHVQGGRASVPHALKEVQRAVSLPQLERHPRGEMQYCYELSPMVFEMNGFCFRMSTDRLLILAWLDEERSVEELESVGGVRFRRNLECLVDHGFVDVENGTASLNRSFSSREYCRIRDGCPDRVCGVDEEFRLGGSREMLDLFEIEYGDCVEEWRRSTEPDSSDVVVEARIMQILKREKRMEMKRIALEVGEALGRDGEFVRCAVGRLVEKEYAAVDGDFVSYVP